MVKEGRVLFGIEHLEQSTGGVSVMSATNLVNLIDQHQGVLSANPLERLDDLARQSSMHGVNRCQHTVL